MPEEGSPSAADLMLMALDTSGPVGSVAVARGSTVLARVSLVEKMEHASRLVPAIGEALERAGAGREDVGGLVVGEGPGSFTGVRVAAATAKGLARALKVPLWAVSSLTGTALVAEAGPIRYVLVDARQDRVYGACYGVGRRDVREMVSPHGGTLGDVLHGEVPEGAAFVGDGAHAHRAAIEGAGFTVVGPADGLCVAEGLVRYLTLRPGKPPLADVGAWEPTYVRPWNGKGDWSG